MANKSQVILPIFYSFLDKLEKSTKSGRKTDPIARAILKKDFQRLQSLWNDEKKAYRHQKSGLNYLQMAVMKGSADIVQFLVDKGMDVEDTAYTVTEDKYSGLSCCHIAVAFRHKHILTYLKTLECSVESSLHILSSGKNYELLHGMAPIHFAVLLNDLNSFNLLLEWRSPLNVQSLLGLSPLHLAAMLNYDTIAQILLKKKVIKNVYSSNDATPVFLAASHGSHKVLKLLIEHEHRLDVTISNGYTAVHAAAEHGAVDSLVLLSRAGCNLDLCATTVDLGDKGLLSGATPLHVAVAAGKRYCVEALLKEGADPNLCCQLKKGEDEVNDVTPLHLAVGVHSEFMVKILVRYGAEVNVLNSNKETPFLMSFLERDLKIERYLLGEEVTDINANNGDALLKAVQENKMELLDVILKHPKVILDHKHSWSTKRKECIRMSPFHIAICEGYVEVVQRLIKHGADVMEKAACKGEDIDSLTPMHIVTVSDHGEDTRKIAKILLEAGSPPDEATIEGITPLMYAVEYTDIDLVHLLLDYGADINKKDKNNLTCLHKFALVKTIFNHRKMLKLKKLFIERGCDVNVQDNKGLTALHYAVEADDLEFFDALLESNRCDLNLKSTEAWSKIPWDNATPLIYVIKCNENFERSGVKLVKKLLDKGASPMERCHSKEELTPMHIAAMYNQTQVMEALLKKGADINALDKLSRSPLYLALKEGKANAAKFLIMKGANLHADSETNEWIKKTPFHLALEMKDTDIIQLLADFGADIFSPAIDDQDRELTPIHIAIKEINTDPILKLIELGADMKTTSCRAPPVQQALKIRALDNSVIKALLRHGVDYHETVYEHESDDSDADDVASIDRHDKDDIPPIMTAVEIADIDRVRHLLQAGADILQTMRDSTSSDIIPAFHAMDEPSKDMVQLLLNMGTDIDASDDSDLNIFHYASYSGYEETVAYLAKCGTDVNKTGYTRKYKRLAPIHVLLYDNFGDVDFCQVLIHSGVDVNATAKLNKNDVSPLIITVSEDQEDVARVLLRHGADVNYKSKTGGGSALNQCIEDVDKKMFKMLMEAGCDVNTAMDDGLTPVVHATIIGQVEMVRAIIGAGGDVNAKCSAFDDDDENAPDCTDATALHQAAELGHAKIAKLLIDAGALVSAEECHRGLPGYTPLHCAALKGHQEVVKVLAKAKCSMNARTEEGETALHLCVKAGDSSMAKLLNSLGINPMIKTKDGNLASALSDMTHFTHELINYELQWTFTHKRPTLLRKRLSLHQRLSLQNLGLFTMNSQSSIRRTASQDGGLGGPAIELESSVQNTLKEDDDDS